MSAAKKIKRALINAVTMTFVSGLSLFLLLYVGHGEGKRTYQEFQVEKLIAQGRIIQNTMDTFLRGGYPVRQFVGFTTMVAPILASDETVASMAVFDQSGHLISASGDGSIPLLPKSAPITTSGSNPIWLHEDKMHLQVVLPLRNRFEQVGSLAISMRKSVIAERIDESFRPLLVVAAVAAVGFGLFVSIGAPLLKGKRRRWLQYTYALTFLGVSALVVATLVSLYSNGAQIKTKTLADSLGQRLTSIVQFGLNITEIQGLDKVLGDYQRLNPDISAAGLIVDRLVLKHTDESAIGKPWKSNRRNYEYIVDLTRPGGRDIRIAVAMPTDIVYRRILRSVKNFAALFVASAFVAGVFLQLAGSVQQGRKTDDEGADPLVESPNDEEADLRLVKPVFFIAVVAEHLTYAFLPQFMFRVAESSGMPEGAASALFMTYYLCFALILMPAGHFAQHVSPRPLMYGGMAMAALGLILLALHPDFYVVMGARALSGFGQGMLFIGVQSYILATVAENRKTQGASIIVFGFQGGMISGMAIGSLLVTQMGPEGVFMLAGAIAVCMAVYTLAVVPNVSARAFSDAQGGASIRILFRDLGRALGSLDFLRTMFCIGVPAKAVLTGVVIFALPVLMTQANYAQEDIGQILMVYGGAVVLASGYASRSVDRTGRTEHALFLGSIVSGAGLVLIGLTGWAPLVGQVNNSGFLTVLLIAGVATVGVAHGFINAPVVTHVANSALAAVSGETSATAAYRFLERLGHVAGPIIVGQLFLFGGQNPMMIAWIGVGVAVLGVFFLIKPAPTQVSYKH